METTLLNNEQAEGLKRLLRDLTNDDREFWESLSAHEQSFFIDIIQEIVKEGYSPKLDALWEFDYIVKPVSIMDAMEANYYDENTGLMSNYYFGPDFHYLYPFWKKELIEVLKPDSEVFEWILTGSIGGGKTTAAVFALAFKLYEISCLRDPHRYYNLMGNAPVVFSLFNVTMGRASLTAYNQLNGIINISPYFREKFPLDTHRKFDDAADDEFKFQLKLPKNIRVILGAKPDSAISANVIAGLLDEVNFKELKSQKISGFQEMEAFKLYSNVHKRIQSRFAKAGRRNPGILCNVSSRQSTTDFLEEHIKNVQGKKGVRITANSIYEFKPKGTYSDKTFSVLIGDKNTNHRVLVEGEQVPADARIEKVPIDFLRDFEYDIDGAIRDICGIATYGNQPFIRDRERLNKCLDLTRENPFPAEVHLGTYDDNSLEDFLNKNALCQMYGTGYRPKLNPHAARFIHLDLSLSGDCTGVSMGHIGSLKTLERVNKDRSVSLVTVPAIVYDFILRILPPRKPTIGQIDYQKIRQFIETLRSVYNFPIKKVTADTYQSADMLQQLEKSGFETDQISLDRNDDGYLQFRMAAMEMRLSFPMYKPFWDEVFDLYHDPSKRKVDHHQGKSKDVSDSVAGVVVSIGMEKNPDSLMDKPPEDLGIMMPPHTKTNQDKNRLTGAAIYQDLLTQIKK